MSELYHHGHPYVKINNEVPTPLPVVDNGFAASLPLFMMSGLFNRPHDYGHHGHHGSREDILATLVNANQNSTGFQNSIDAAHKAGNDAINAVHVAQTDINGEVRAGTLAGIQATHLAQSSITKEVTDGHYQNLQATRDGVEKLLMQSCDGFRDLTKDVCDGFNSITRELCDVRKEVGDVKYAVALSTQQILLENAKGEGRTREMLLQQSADARLEACKNTDAIQRAIEASAREAAECCCETQSLIREQECKTQALLRDQECKTRELFLQQKNENQAEKIAQLQLQIALLGNNTGGGLVRAA